MFFSVPCIKYVYITVSCPWWLCVCINVSGRECGFFSFCFVLFCFIFHAFIWHLFLFLFRRGQNCCSHFPIILMFYSWFTVLTILFPLFLLSRAHIHLHWPCSSSILWRCQKELLKVTSIDACALNNMNVYPGHVCGLTHIVVGVSMITFMSTRCVDRWHCFKSPTLVYGDRLAMQWIQRVSYTWRVYASVCFSEVIFHCIKNCRLKLQNNIYRFCWVHHTVRNIRWTAKQLHIHTHIERMVIVSFRVFFVVVFNIFWKLKNHRLWMCLYTFSIYIPRELIICVGMWMSWCER